MRVLISQLLLKNRIYVVSSFPREVIGFASRSQEAVVSGQWSVFIAQAFDKQECD